MKPPLPRLSAQLETYFLARNMAEAQLLAKIHDIPDGWRFLASSENLFGTTNPLVYKTLCWSRVRRGATPEIHHRNVREIIEELHTRDAQVILIDCPHPHKDSKDAPELAEPETQA